MRIKYWSYDLTAAILSKVQREPRFFQLIRYLSSYIYVIRHTHLPSLPSPKSRGKKDYFSISRDDWSLYIFTTESVINVLINHCGVERGTWSLQEKMLCVSCERIGAGDQLPALEAVVAACWGSPDDRGKRPSDLPLPHGAQCTVAALWPQNSWARNGWSLTFWYMTDRFL